MPLLDRTNLTVWTSLSVLLGLLLVSGVAHAKTLTETLADAYYNNPSLKARQAELRATDELVPQARAGWFPTVSVTGSEQSGKQILVIPTTDPNTGAPTTTRQIINSDNPTASVQVTETLYQGGHTVAQTKSAEYQVLAEREALNDTERQVLLNAVAAFDELIRAEAAYENARQNEASLLETVKIIREQQRIGEATKTDIALTETRYQRATQNRLQAKADMASARATYEQVTGTIPGPLDEPSLPTGLPDSFDAAVQLAMTDNPLIAQAHYREQSAQADVEVQTSVLKPTLQAQLSANASFHTLAGYNKTTEKVGSLQLTVPIYQGGSEYSAVRQARQIVSQRLSERVLAESQARQAIVRDWDAFQSSAAQLESAQAAVNAAEIAVTGNKKERLAGTRSVLDVLDAEEQYIEARNGLELVKRDKLNAAYEILSDIGALSAQSLALPVQLYDPIDHYNQVRHKLIGLD